MLKIIKLWVPAVIWACFIFYLSNTPGLRFYHLGNSWIYPLKEFSLSHPYVDLILRKMAHYLEYFILTFLLWKAFKESFNLDDHRLCVYPTLVSLLYAAFDEIHKLHIADRHPCIRNFIIDLIGIFSFYLVLKFLAKRRSDNITKRAFK